MALARLALASLWLSLVASCAHDRAWVAEKTERGGTIGYSRSSFEDDRGKTVKDFKKVATKICKGKEWQVVREIIPPPTDAVSAARNASHGDARGAVNSGSHAFMSDQLHRAKRLDKKVKVEYGSPLKSWNEAEVRCKT